MRTTTEPDRDCPAGEEEVVPSRFSSLEEIFVNDQSFRFLSRWSEVLIGQIQKNPEVQIKPCDRDGLLPRRWTILVNLYIFLFWMLEQLLL